MFRFNANISYSGVLHAVTQDVSVSKSCVIYVHPSARAGFTLISPAFISLISSLQGLFSENKEKLINNAILALLSQEAELPALNAELESHFQAIRRLVASKAGFQAFTQLPK